MTVDNKPNLAWDAAETRRRMELVISEHGPWTAHNVHLGHDIFPLGSAPTPDDTKLHRVTTIVDDCLRGSVAGARILDLGCLEGSYAVEFARRGAEVVAIEGRAPQGGLVVAGQRDELLADARVAEGRLGGSGGFRPRLNAYCLRNRQSHRTGSPFWRWSRQTWRHFESQFECK